MASSVTVRKVTTPADSRAFFGFPWTLYRNDPHWVPPLPAVRRETLDPQKSPSWEYLEGDYYTAWRGDQMVGTIAAFVNHRHNKFHKENVAWFGFFEVYDDPDAAHALLNTALEWARTHGFSALRGPQSFTTHEEVGLLIDGFTRPVVLTPYNPPYYLSLIENAGFVKVKDIVSFYYSRRQMNEDNIRPRFAKMAERIRNRSHITIRTLDRSKLKRDFELFKDIYNDAWEHNWGFTPMTPKELDAVVDNLGMIVNTDLACFAYIDDEPAGFLLAVPDLNQAIKPAYPRPDEPHVLTLLKILWHWKVRDRIDWMRIPLMGVREKFRGRGVDVVMFDFILTQAAEKTRVEHVDCGWILEDNHALVNLARKLEMDTYKTHRFYEKPV